MIIGLSSDTSEVVNVSDGGVNVTISPGTMSSGSIVKVTSGFVSSRFTSGVPS